MVPEPGGKKVLGFKKAIFSGLTTRSCPADRGHARGASRARRPLPRGGEPIDKFELLNLTKEALGVTVDIEPARRS